MEPYGVTEDGDFIMFEPNAQVKLSAMYYTDTFMVGEDVIADVPVTALCFMFEDKWFGIMIPSGMRPVLVDTLRNLDNPPAK